MATQVLTDDNFQSEVVDKGGMAVVDLWATWCGPCRAMGPQVEAASNEMSDVRFYKLDIEASPNTPTEFGVMNIPTLLFFKEGKLVDKSVGLISKDAILKKITDHK